MSARTLVARKLILVLTRRRPSPATEMHPRRGRSRFAARGHLRVSLARPTEALTSTSVERTPDASRKLRRLGCVVLRLDAELVIGDLLGAVARVREEVVALLDHGNTAPSADGGDRGHLLVADDPGSTTGTISQRWLRSLCRLVL
jgi:hypothetical protein